MHALDVLKERGFLAQITFEEELYKRMENDSISFYVGFDPTAASLHIGHCIPIMAMAHLQKAGHRPIALVGSGTTMVGDPSGRTDMRKMLSIEGIASNAMEIRKQLARFIRFDNKDGAMLVNNADWLLDLNYISFLRDIGSLFSVNRMLTADCYKQRLERGLTFLEFNYMLMQSYDFLELFRRYNCRLQLGGDDQWSNILAGADLIRRKEGEDAFACTCKLLLNHEGVKMGKTVKGALWLNPDMCSPYDFYQYWRNIDDQDVEKCLALLTFLPMDEVRRLGRLEGSAINESKAILAYEITALVHGSEEAEKAQQAASALFGSGSAIDQAPKFEITKTLLGEDARLTTLLSLCGLCASRSEARKLVAQGAVFIGENKISDIDYQVSEDMLIPDGILLRKGKKSYCRLLLVE